MNSVFHVILLYLNVCCSSRVMTCDLYIISCLASSSLLLGFFKFRQYEKRSSNSKSEFLKFFLVSQIHDFHVLSSYLLYKIVLLFQLGIWSTPFRNSHARYDLIILFSSLCSSHPSLFHFPIRPPLFWMIFEGVDF